MDDLIHILAARNDGSKEETGAAVLCDVYVRIMQLEVFRLYNNFMINSHIRIILYTRNLINTSMNIICY